MPDKQTAVHKRQKIQDSNKAMFIWVAAASVVVGFAAVVSWFLWQQTAFKMKIASEKEATVSTLKANNESVSKLRDDIRVLQTNANLQAAKTTDDDNAVQVVLDALPADGNPLALGASLQQKLIAGIPNLKLESLRVDPIDASASGENTISFTITVSSSDPNTLKELLSRFERSIRVIDIDTLQVQRSDTKYTLNINAHAYYQPAKTITLEDKAL
ncbi:MAG TPA: GspMb/PilO family protein [Patescibacteria group bacterium]|nr:GspMb/PilO family protein [Patescibacteria group bacterium]